MSTSRRTNARAARLIVAAMIGALTAVPVAAQPSYNHFRLIAPAAPGGGWDQTARVMQQVLQTTHAVRTSTVENIPGAAGTIGLARFISAERGASNALMLSGLIMLGGIVTHRSPVTLRDVTPIARLIGEYEVIAAPMSSPFHSLGDLMEAFKQKPESISWGGGSAGGSDQILAGLIADAIGVPPSRVNYIAFSGGGDSLSAVLGGQVSVGINGLAEFEGPIAAGSVRVLAISSAERLPGLSAPTLREQGVDVEFENWRSVVAPPGLSAADIQRLSTLVAGMVRSNEWRAMLARHRWLDRYLAGEDLSKFVRAEEQRVQAILRKLGASPGADAALSIETYPLLVLVGVCVFGLAALVQTVRTTKASSDNAPSTQPARPWRPVAMVGAGIALDLLLLQPAGFVVASAVLFWFTARAFDPRRPWRDLAFSIAVSISSYLLFVRLLKLQLPAGVLGRWL